MANARFGVNILPKNNTETLGNSDHPWTIVSPALTGTPTAPTAADGTKTGQIATTEFVQNAKEGMLDDIVAPEYDSTATYAVGDYCTYNGELYRCNTAIDVAEDWTAAHWDKISITEELDKKADKDEAVTSVDYDTTNKKITKTVNGRVSDIVSVSTIKTDLGKFTWGQLAGKSDPT